MKILKAKKKILFLMVFLALYCLAVMVSVLAAFGIDMDRMEGIEPQGGAKIIEPAAHRISEFLMWPTSLIHDIFFMGRPLPINDWFWLILNGLLYGAIVLVIWNRFSRPSNNRA